MHDGAAAGARPGVLGGATLVVIAASAIARFTTVHGAFFAQDDWAYFADAQRFGVDGDWLFKTWFGHLAPLHRLSFSVLEPTQAAWIGLLLVQVALVAAACWIFFLSLRLLFGSTWWLVPAVAWLGFSSVLELPLLWPSAGLQQVPDLLANLVALYGYLRFVRGDGRRWAFLAVAAMAIALPFYIRPLVIPVYLVLLRVLLLQRDLRPAAVLRGLWSERLVWGGFVVVGVVYLGFFLHSGATSGHAATTVSQLVDFLRIAWLRTLSFTLVGADVPTSTTLAGGQLVLQIAVQVAAVALVIGSVLGKRAALRAWAYVALGLAVTLAVIAYGRLGVLGPGVAYELRYFTNVAWLVPLGLLFAFDRRSVLDLADGPPASPAPAPARPHASARLVPRPAAGVVVGAAVAIAVVYAVASVVTGDRVSSRWFGNRARTFTEDLRAAASRLPAGTSVRVLDAKVPGHVIIPEAFSPEYSSDAVVAGLLTSRLRFDDPRGPQRVIASDGNLVPGRFRGAWRRDRWTGVEQVTGGGAAATVVARDGDRRVCLRPTATTTASLELQAPRPVTTPNGGVLVRVRLAEGSRVDRPVPVFVDAGDGYPGATELRLRPPAGSRTSTLDARASSLVKLRIDAPPGQPFCLSRVEVGTFDPVPSR